MDPGFLSETGFLLPQAKAAPGLFGEPGRLLFSFLLQALQRHTEIAAEEDAHKFQQGVPRFLYPNPSAP